MRTAIKALFFLPLAIAINGCGGDFQFENRYAAIYRMSYDRSDAVDRSTVTGELLVDVQDDGDVDFVIEDSLYGTIVGSGELSDEGTFTGSADFKRGNSITIEGEVHGEGQDATVSGTVSGNFAASFAGGYYADRDENIFAGTYVGSYDGVESGKVIVVVNTDGSIDAEVHSDLDALGVGSMDTLGAATFSAAGDGFNFDFLGRFRLKGTVRHGDGTYNVSGNATGSGTWAAPEEL